MSLARWVVPLLLAMLPVTACGDGEVPASAGSDRPRPGDSAAVDGPPTGWLASPPYAAGAVVGKTYEGYWLDTHCGVNGARLDGSYWDATNGSAARDGWGNPYQQGAMRMTSHDRAIFTADSQSVEYVRTSAPDYPPCA